MRNVDRHIILPLEAPLTYSKPQHNAQLVVHNPTTTKPIENRHPNPKHPTVQKIN